MPRKGVRITFELLQQGALPLQEPSRMQTDEALRIMRNTAREALARAQERDFTPPSPDPPPSLGRASTSNDQPIKAQFGLYSGVEPARLADVCEGGERGGGIMTAHRVDGLSAAAAAGAEDRQRYNAWETAHRRGGARYSRCARGARGGGSLSGGRSLVAAQQHSTSHCCQTKSGGDFAGDCHGGRDGSKTSILQAVEGDGRDAHAGAHAQGGGGAERERALFSQGKASEWGEDAHVIKERLQHLRSLLTAA